MALGISDGDSKLRDLLVPSSCGARFYTNMNLVSIGESNLAKWACEMLRHIVRCQFFSVLLQLIFMADLLIAVATTQLWDMFSCAPFCAHEQQ